MTVVVPDSGFLRLLFKWRGSLWKATLRAYFIWLIIYFIINFSYRFAFDLKQKKQFYRLVRQFSAASKMFPLEFLLGFYVSAIVTRWWNQFMCVSYPDEFITTLCSLMPSNDKETVRIRNTLVRWTNLLSIVCWSGISTKIKKRFPTYEHFVKAGLMTPGEYELIESTSADYGRWFLPQVWALNLMQKCRESGKLSEFSHIHLMQKLQDIRSNGGTLFVYDWVDLPLIYTQVVTVATYGYFGLALLGRQSLTVKQVESDNYIDIYFPLFTTLQFFFYFAWLKVGETLRCPFGEDDDDFDMNYIIDRNVAISRLYLDVLHYQHPPVDQTYVLSTNAGATCLPHTIASSKKGREKMPPTRIQNMKISPKQLEYSNADWMQGATWRRCVSVDETSNNTIDRKALARSLSETSDMTIDRKTAARSLSAINEAYENGDDENLHMHESKSTRSSSVVTEESTVASSQETPSRNENHEVELPRHDGPDESPTEAPNDRSVELNGTVMVAINNLHTKL